MMTTEDTPDYANMSLDDVIRDMKARKSSQEVAPEDNSPFLRQNNKPSVKDRLFRPTFIRRRAPKNFVSNFARKRVQQARRTLDLRNKIIHQRVTREGLDLRWKLVATMIAKLRQQENRFQGGHRYHPYPSAAPFRHAPHPQADGSCNAFPQQRISKASLTQIERLVGKLPRWMNPNNKPGAPSQPRVHQQYYPTGPGPIRTRPHVHHNSGMCSPHPVCQMAHPVPTHIHGSCPNIHNSCQTPHTHSHCQQMPPLVFEPPPPSFRTQHPHLPQNVVGGGADHIDEIAIVVPNESGEFAQAKRTLHERFSL